MILGTQCWQTTVVMVSEGALDVSRLEAEPVDTEREDRTAPCYGFEQVLNDLTTNF